MIIRKYKDADKESVLSLLRLNTPKFFSATEEADFVHYLNHEAENYFLIEVENKILACGGFNRTDDDAVVRISWDIIDPKSQGKGLGTELTKFRISKIKEIHHVTTIAVRTSQLVFKFYERFGFKTKEIIKDYWAAGYDMYYMDCDINGIRMA